MKVKSGLFLKYISVLVFFFLFFILQSCNKPEKQPGNTSIPGNVKVLSSHEDLQNALDSNSSKLMVIDLYADWCMPCKQLSPVLNSLSIEHTGNTVFYKVNVDKNPEIAAMFGVQGIPHVVFVKNKEPFYAITGLYPKDAYKKVITVCGAAESPDICQKQMQM
ncbi:MAG: thioredoxin family protein [Fibrobacter sp.]|nr:thioredoxin family protein [Fibrobacter sp.]